MDEDLTLTDEVDVQTKLESVKATKAYESVDKKINIDFQNPEVDKAPLKIQGSISKEEAIPVVKIADNILDKKEIDWDDQELELMATQLQAGYRGMRVREDVREQDEEERRLLAIKGIQIEKRLGICFEDPAVVNAVTQIQAGFRGVLTRKNMKGNILTKTPEILVEQAFEAGTESEYTYEYEDENDESESLKDRPATPTTAVDKNREDFNIAGFRASAIITTWLQRRRRSRTLTEVDKDSAATRIQAGYRGLVTRELHKWEEKERGNIEVTSHDASKSSLFRMAASIALMATRRRTKTYPSNIRYSKDDLNLLNDVVFSESEEDDIATRLQAGYSGMTLREEIRDPCPSSSQEKKEIRDPCASSTQEKKVTVEENIPMSGLDSGVGNSFSSRETTPRDNDSKMEKRNESKESESFSEEDEEDSESESESEGEVVKGKTPFVLLKQLVGIMRLSGGVGRLKTLSDNNLPKIDVPETESGNNDLDSDNTKEELVTNISYNAALSNSDTEPTDIVKK